MTNGEQTRELIFQATRTIRAFRQAVQRMLRLHNVEMTFEMLQVMVRLWQQQGISQQRLAEWTAKDKACLTNLINNLTKKGWVTRREDDTDRRTRLIYLTERGEALSAVVWPVLNELYDRAGDGMGIRPMRQSRNCLAELNGIFDEM